MIRERLYIFEIGTSFGLHVMFLTAYIQRLFCTFQVWFEFCFHQHLPVICRSSRIGQSVIIIILYCFSKFRTNQRIALPLLQTTGWLSSLWSAFLICVLYFLLLKFSHKMIFLLSMYCNLLQLHYSGLSQDTSHFLSLIYQNILHFCIQ